jgi:hypothetical protein
MVWLTLAGGLAGWRAWVDRQVAKADHNATRVSVVPAR